MKHRRIVGAVGVAAISLTAAFASIAPAGAQAVEPVEIVGTNLSDFPTVRLSVAVSGDDLATGPVRARSR
jgi:hypothetical protein